MANHDKKSVAPSEMAASGATNGTTEIKDKSSSAERAAVKLAMNPTKKVSDKANQLQALCDAFIKVKTGDKKVKLINGRHVTYPERCINAFKRTVNFVWSNQDDPDVLHTYRKFFTAYRNTYLSSTEALQGMNYVTSDAERNKYGIIYMLFFELTNPQRNRNAYDFEYATKVCQNLNCATPNGIIEFIASRIR